MARASDKITASTPRHRIPGETAEVAARRRIAVLAAEAASKSKPAFLTVRHYCQGLGDCHLLKFRRADGSDFFMLIDCGIHSSVKGGSQKVDAVVADIASVTKRLDVLVITHEHIDHLSGFLSAADKFKQLTIGEVWMGWTENPRDAQARKLDEFKGQALAVLGEAGRQLDSVKSLNAHLANVRDGLEAILGFNFGVKGERVRAARDAAAALATKGIRYLEPSSGVLSLEGVDGLRIYVLGPPRDETLLKIAARESEMYDIGGGAGSPLIAAFRGAFNLSSDGTGDSGAPFDLNVGMPLNKVLGTPEGDEEHQVADFLEKHYCGPPPQSSGQTAAARKAARDIDPNLTDHSWRRIDLDWLAASATLAMQLDDVTNNTSLVLAFESVETGRVMLFVGDAQIGSWLSWQDLKWAVGSDEVTGSDLLARAVYYTVGHHGSHNATAKAKGLQLMINRDLSAFIPTNEQDAKKVGWGEMPFHSILKDLDIRTQGRTVRADDAWVSSGKLPLGLSAPSGSLQAVRCNGGLWVEFDLA
ncbi:MULTISPECIES: hypothetical protein [Sinorhizobium]|uniref:hypothetical protein n=1 Tax=Sinorhizobium TaxID=28105 RepID=UPI000BEA9640|nr:MULTISPECIES: hypothetical protein [Sinorhizobium]